MIKTDVQEYRAIPAGTNLAIVILQIGGIFACFYGAKVATEWWHLALLAAGFGIVMNSVYAVIHEAEHGILFPNKRVNDAFGILMALFFPAPFHLIRQGHLGHHLRNRSDDEAFELYFEEEHALAKYVQWYGILTGLFWVVVASSSIVALLFPFLMNQKHYAIDRPSSAFFDSLNATYWRLIRIEAVLVVVTHAAVLWVLQIPPLHYAVVYLGFGLSWSTVQYLHHYGTERHVTRGARNLWMLPILDSLLLNHNWHLTHHKHPTVPWRYLPDLGRREDPSREFFLGPYLKMWKGPRYTNERVENLYAGRVIR